MNSTPWVSDPYPSHQFLRRFWGARDVDRRIDYQLLPSSQITEAGAWKFLATPIQILSLMEISAAS